MYNRKTSSQKAQAFLKKSQKKIDELKEKLIELSKREDKLEKEKEEQIKLEHRREAKEIRVTLNVESVVKSMIAILLILGLTRILGILQPVIVIFLVALFLSATLNPAVDKLHGYKVPRPLVLSCSTLVLLESLWSCSQALFQSSLSKLVIWRFVYRK